MKKLFKILVYIVFVTFVAPSFYIFLTTLHKKVVEEKVPFQEVAARAPEYSFLPVTNFWLQQYNRFFVESEMFKKKEDNSWTEGKKRLPGVPEDGDSGE